MFIEHEVLAGSLTLGTADGNNLVGKNARGNGVTTVAKVEPDFEVLAENTLEGYTLSSFAVSEGRLFLRNDKALYCIGES